MFIIISVILLTCLVLMFRWRLKNIRLLELSARIPGPPVVPLFGNALKFMCQTEDVTSVIKEIITEYGDVFRFWLGPELNVVVSNPEDLKTLLTSPKTSVKGPQYKYMAEVLGGGILSGSGIVWRKHRKIASPNYGKKGVEGYTDVFNQEARMLLLNLDTIPEEKQINIYKEVIKCTTYAVCQTIMGLSREETMQISHLQEIIDLSPRIYDIIFRRMIKWYLQIDAVFRLTELYGHQKYFIRLMNEFGRDIIRRRRDKLNNESTIEKRKIDLYSEEDNSSNAQLCIVDRFLLSNELSMEELIQEVFTLFTASQEATGKICSYLLLMMAFHPKYQEYLYQEIKKVFGDDERQVTEDDLKRMPYLDMVYKEVLRLFPIGAMLQRTVQEDITISSCTIPAGSSLVIPVYHIQRDHRFWKNPEDFDPDRFSPTNSNFRHPYCYIPFSLGPMDCLGRYFGTKLIKTIAVRVLQKFELSSRSKYKDLRLAICISVSSLDGYPVILTPRQKI